MRPRFGHICFCTQCISSLIMKGGIQSCGWVGARVGG